MSNMKVPVTSDPRLVWLAQRGLAPSEATMRMARLLHQMEALRRVEAMEAEGDDKR
jgi:hypothetical protein